MEKVVYVLGAGFSAPLGLPVISNFRFKSQDMYFAGSAKYSYFTDVFQSIERMAVSKNYYQTDLFNIEEILSILEMADYLEGRRLKDEFVRYITDVIEYYTPPLSPYPNRRPSNWDTTLFGEDNRWRPYGAFVASLLNLYFEKKFHPLDIDFIEGRASTNPDTLYGVVTLNYDRVLESVCDFLDQRSGMVGQGSAMVGPACRFSTASDVPGHTFEIDQPVRLAKLHGSIGGPDIVPPTWSKGVNTAIVPAWNLAQRLLGEATYIRFIGFSLPVADAYIKYLLKSASVLNKYLKGIDVICLDPNGAVRRRYDDFIQFGYYRFAEANTTDYLGFLTSHYASAGVRQGNVSFNSIEEYHEQFMQGKRL